MTGDVNFDGTINSSDLGLLLNNFGGMDNPSYEEGDLNGDGSIDSGDLGLLLNNFGFNSIVLPTSASVAVVPEPSHFGWLAVLLAAFAARRRSDR